MEILTKSSIKKHLRHKIIETIQIVILLYDQGLLSKEVANQMIYSLQKSLKNIQYRRNQDSLLID
jgi:hypothetical protein